MVLTRVLCVVLAGCLCVAACGCGPEKSGAATPAKKAGYQPTQADRAYWDAFCAAWQGGRGINHEDAFASLSVQGVTDPMLIKIHNAWVDFFDEWNQFRDRLQAGPMDIGMVAVMPTKITGVHMAKIQPLVTKAQQRYGPPQ